jgi:hypothetical protein
LQHAELKSQKEDLPGKTKRTKEDALLNQARTWLIIASKLAGDKVGANPEELPKGAARAARERALSVVIAVATDVEDLTLRQHFVNSMSTTTTIATISVVTILGMRSTTKHVRVLGLRR